MCKKLPGVILILGLLTAIAIDEGKAQTYDPVYRPDVTWKEINSERFRMIFPESAEETARRSLRILETQYEEVQRLVGGELKNFPVVVNDYNDRTGGFVTTNHFRIEVEAPTRRTKSVNPRTGGWLELVIPHELVHALHLSVVPEYSLARLIKPIAPDLAPAFHLTAPFGLLEGIAVYHESNVRPGEGGRGNHPYFTNQIMANFDSDERWSIGELVYPSARTRPAGRHYLGGYAFTKWLHETYGDEVTKEVIDKLNQRFFLGYGIVLRNVTGKWPWELDREFVEYQETRYKPKTDSIRGLGVSPYEVIHTGLDGAWVSRPQYLNDEELLFYGSFYNERAGLWKLSAENSSIERVYTGTMVGNYLYDIVDESSVAFSRFVSHPYYHNTWKMDLFDLDPASGNLSQITEDARVHNPVFHGDRIMALQTHQETSQWVELNEGEVVDTLLSIYPDNIHEMAARSGDDGHVAIAANINGKQGVWLVDQNDPQLEKSTPDLAFSYASIFDLHWHPEGDKLLFSSDENGVMNIYEWDLQDDTVYQVTNSLYNAFEGSYHPGGDKIVFVVQKESTRKPATLERENFFNRRVDFGTRVTEISEYVNRSRIGDELQAVSLDWQTENYQTGLGWLRPRAVYPIASFDDIYPQQRFGATVASGDVLRRNKYELSLSYGGEYLWYDAQYTRRSFYPGYTIRAFSNPSSSGNLGLQSQGFSLSTRLPYTLENNLYFSGITVTPDIRYSRLRAVYQEGVLPEPSDWIEQYRASVRFSYAYRLQQNLQDMQPNTGLQLYNQWYAGFTDEFTGSMDYAVSGGAFGYLSSLRRYNQSLRLGLEFQYSNGILLDQTGFLTPGFQVGDLPDTDHLLRFSSRYIIPLLHADKAWLLLPSQLQSVYGVLFTNTISPLDFDFAQTIPDQTRTVYGAELRTRFELFNLTFDAGLRFGYEPTRGDYRITFVL